MEEFNKAIMKQYPIKNMTEKPFSFPKEPESVLKQLLFLLNVMIDLGYTLSVICPMDFVFRDKVLLLKSDVHVVPLEEGHFNYKEHKEYGKCFVPEMIKEGKNPLSVTYASVGLFAYYLWTRKKKSRLTEMDYGKLKGTKVYYFIKNSMVKNPILLYL
jgi:hypothetical protein